MPLNRITNIRLRSQQLVKPEFKDPKELVAWMGAVQAQDYRMVRWALGVRLKSGSLKTVEDAFQKGEILRTHVMRPTWHMVTSDDIRWMLKLSSQRIITACNTFAKGNGINISEELYSKANDHFIKVLAGNNHLTKQELGEEMVNSGIISDAECIGYLLTRAEQEAIVCSGADKGGKATYALLAERAPMAVFFFSIINIATPPISCLSTTTYPTFSYRYFVFGVSSPVNNRYLSQ